jgi:plastocyanin
MKSGAIIGIIVVVVLLIGGFFLFQPGDSPTKEPEPETTDGDDEGIIEVDSELNPPTINPDPEPSPEPSGPTTHTVEIKNFKLPTLTIKVGDTIEWTNEDSAVHTTTSTDDETFDSGRLRDGEKYSFTFTEKGTFPYFCEVHPSMKGTIIVK